MTQIVHSNSRDTRTNRTAWVKRLTRTRSDRRCCVGAAATLTLTANYRRSAALFAGVSGALCIISLRGMSESTRQEALATLQQGNDALAALFAQLSPDQMVKAATIGGGDWSAKDLLGHIAFWEELAAQTLAEWRAGQRPSIENAFGQPATDAANARNQERTA